MCFGGSRCRRVLGSIVGVLVCGGCEVVAPGVRSGRVVPVDPSQDLELDMLEGAPRALATDQFGLEDPVERLGGGVVVGVALGSDGSDAAEFLKAFGVADSSVLNAAVRVNPNPG